MLSIYLGYDSREPAALYVATASILEHASRPVSIVPLVQRQLREQQLYGRTTGGTEATEFSLTRFLVPFLSDYKGISLFCDSDMLFRADVYDVLQYVNGDMAVSVCQHNYTPKGRTKMDGKVQANYPRKNWSSFMIFNNEKCRALDLYAVNAWDAAFLQQFKWLGDKEIGSLPLEWNWLVGEYSDNPNAKVLHYTLGGPWFDPWFKSLVKILN